MVVGVKTCSISPGYSMDITPNLRTRVWDDGSDGVPLVRLLIDMCSISAIAKLNHAY